MKKSNILLISALAITLVVIVAAMIFVRVNLMAQVLQGDGNLTEQQRTIANWEKVKVHGNIHVYYTQNESNTLLLKADENLLEFIRTEVQDNLLIIESIKPIHSRNDLQIELSNAFLTEVEATAASRFIARNELNFTEIKITANAGALIDISGVFEILNVFQNAGAKVKLAGQTQAINITSNAGGSVDAEKMQAQTAEVEANAGASASVNAQTLNATASSGATISYVGSPVFSGMEINSGARIRAIN